MQVYATIMYKYNVPWIPNMIAENIEGKRQIWMAFKLQIWLAWTDPELVVSAHRPVFP